MLFGPEFFMELIIANPFLLIIMVELRVCALSSCNILPFKKHNRAAVKTGAGEGNRIRGAPKGLL